MLFRSRIPAPLLAVGVAVGLTALAYGGGNVVVSAVISALRGLGIQLTPRQRIVLSIVVLQLVFFIGVSLAYLRYRGLSLADIGVRVPTLEGWIVLGVGFVGMIILLLVGSIGSFVVGQWLGIERESQVIFEMAQQDPLIFLLVGALSLLIVGPAEELLFRGVIQTRLRETFGVVAGITIATALFAIVHITGYGSLDAGLLGISVLFLIGCVLALAYEYTGNLVVVAIMHGLFNASQMALAYASVRFGDPESMIALVEVATAIASLK